MSTKVKICGVRDAETAMVAADAGANYIGLVFVENVRRQLLPIDGQSIVRSFRIRGGRRSKETSELIGLFRNQDKEWVNQSSRTIDLDGIQLTGDENERYIRSMWKPVFRQVRISKTTKPKELKTKVQNLLNGGCHVILDSFDPKTPGGTGKSFNWEVARGIASLDRVLLAGGLTPENVAGAIRELSPWGVDVSSGVETNGVKDHKKIQDFIQASREH